MNASILWENPGLALLGILAVIFLFLLFPILGAVRRSREEESHELLRVREPSIHGDRYRDERQDYGDYFADQGEERSSDRRNSRDDLDDDIPAGVFGSGSPKRTPKPTPKLKTVRSAGPARSLWFVIGVCVGAGGLALWWNMPTVGTVKTLVSLFDKPNPPAVIDRPVRPAETKAQDRFGPSGEPVSASPATVAANDETAKLVEDFVTSLKAQIPMAVGPGITMDNADFKANTIALGFTIAQSVADEDAPKLQTELESRFKKSVCATPPDPSNIHGLNELGVAFLIDYVDLLGKKVAGLTVEPRFCSKQS